VKVALVILGEPASKANSRKPATVGPKDNRRTIWIKSDKARSYEESALMQIPASVRVMLEGPVRFTATIFYATQRSDLDESLVLDVLQARYSKPDKDGHRELIRRGVYVNDRQVREKHIYHAIDKTNPRTEIVVEALSPQQTELTPQEETV
jgi:hypothetical protein